MKIETSKIEAVLTATGYGSRVMAGDKNISNMIDRVEVTTDSHSGTSIVMRIPLCDCRVAGVGEVMILHPIDNKLVAVAEITLKDGRKLTFEDADK